MIRRSPLTPDEREAIREMKDSNPRMTQREIGALFNVSGPTIHNVLTYWKKPTGPRVTMALPPSSVKLPESIIRPITKAMLMGGNARRVRSVA